MLSFLALRMGFFCLYIGLKQAWQWAAISAMHQIAQWRGREADRASSVTTRRSLCPRVSFGTCAQGSGKSRWHVGGRVRPHKLPVQTQSTYHLHFDVTASVSAQEAIRDKNPVEQDTVLHSVITSAHSEHYCFTNMRTIKLTCSPLYKRVWKLMLPWNTYRLHMWHTLSEEGLQLETSHVEGINVHGSIILCADVNLWLLMYWTWHLEFNFPRCAR